MVASETSTRFQSLGRLIGNTPMLAIRFRFRGRERMVYAKSEQFNLTGSIKDRMAFYILRHAYRTGEIREGDTIAEASSGNSGIAFAAVGRALGHPVVILMPDWMSQERVGLLHSLGASVIPVSREEGGFQGCLDRAEALAFERRDVFLPRQFSNEADVEAHEVSTGPEIRWQLESEGLIPDAFVAGVGTGGTIMGAGRFLREWNPALRVYPSNPAEGAAHRIQGITGDFIPPIVKPEELDTPIPVRDGDAILMAQRLAAELGLAVGISSGMNLLAAIEAQNRLGPDAIVTTVFPDDNKKYLTTDLLREEPVREGYLAPHVELLSFETVKRVCNSHCEFPGR